MQQDNKNKQREDTQDFAQHFFRVVEDNIAVAIFKVPKKQNSINPRGFVTLGGKMSYCKTRVVVIERVLKPPLRVVTG